MFILRAINYKVKYSSQVRQITQIEAKFTIHCNQFQNCHAFTNHMIRDEMIKAIRRYDSDDDEVINLWSDRQDTGLENDVFYIENDIKTKNEITIYFSLIVTCYKGDNDHSTMITSKLTRMINDICNDQSEIQKTLLQSLHARMNLIGDFNVKYFKLSNLRILKQETMIDDNVVSIPNTSSRSSNIKSRTSSNITSPRNSALVLGHNRIPIPMDKNDNDNGNDTGNDNDNDQMQLQDIDGSSAQDQDIELVMFQEYNSKHGPGRISVHLNKKIGKNINAYGNEDELKMSECVEDVNGRVTGHMEVDMKYGGIDIGETHMSTIDSVNDVHRETLTQTAGETGGGDSIADVPMDSRMSQKLQSLLSGKSIPSIVKNEGEENSDGNADNDNDNNNDNNNIIDTMAWGQKSHVPGWGDKSTAT